MANSGRPQVEDIHSRGVEPWIIPDPGDAGTIDTLRSGYCEITSGGAETRTLGDPTFRGQELDIVFISDGGTVTITSSSPVNQTGNNTITLTDIGEMARFVGHYNATDGWEWYAYDVGNGAALTTV